MLTFSSKSSGTIKLDRDHIRDKRDMYVERDKRKRMRRQRVARRGGGGGRSTSARTVEW